MATSENIVFKRLGIILPQQELLLIKLSENHIGKLRGLSSGYKYVIFTLNLQVGF